MWRLLLFGGRRLERFIRELYFSVFFFLRVLSAQRVVLLAISSSSSGRVCVCVSTPTADSTRRRIFLSLSGACLRLGGRARSNRPPPPTTTTTTARAISMRTLYLKPMLLLLWRFLGDIDDNASRGAAARGVGQCACTHAQRCSSGGATATSI